MSPLDVLTKVTFHSGIVEETLFDLLAKTNCQIIIQAEENKSAQPVKPATAVASQSTRSTILGRPNLLSATAFVKKEPQNQPANSGYFNLIYTIDHDGSNKQNATPAIHDDNNDPFAHLSLSNFGIRTSTRFRIGEEFSFAVPITGEKVAVSSVI